MYQNEVMIPASDKSNYNRSRLTEEDEFYRSPTGSGQTLRQQNFIGRKMVYPDNVIRLGSATPRVKHSATFPLGLPSWFIKLFTQEGDIVLDPFIGSGTTALAAIELGRHYIGVDIQPEYVLLSNQQIEELQNND